MRRRLKNTRDKRQDYERRTARAAANDVVAIRLGAYDLSIAHLCTDTFSTLETGSVDPDHLAREQPGKLGTANGSSGTSCRAAFATGPSVNTRRLHTAPGDSDEELPGTTPLNHRQASLSLHLPPVTPLRARMHHRPASPPRAQEPTARGTCPRPQGRKDRSAARRSRHR